jgi:branched-chain amino acid transport system permease protein
MQFTRIPKTIVVLSSLAVMVAVPWIASDYFVMMCIRVMYFGMLTLSLCFLAGELGVVSLMQASFFGISGYFIAILQTRYQIPFPIPPWWASGWRSCLPR